MTKKNEIVVRGEDRMAQAEGFIQQAIASNAPIETMERLLAMRKELKAEAAKEAFVAALAQFQQACPVIKKTKIVYNKDGRTERYRFAPIDSIVEQIKGPLKKAELSYRWETKQEKDQVTAICYITHVLGHTESSDFSAPIDPEGYMTAPQKFASALTFAKRYSLCNALGISTGDEDTDATDVNKEKEPKSDKAKIVSLLKALNAKHKTAEECAESVKKLTTLELEEKNFKDIITRLKAIYDENHEN